MCTAISNYRSAFSCTSDICLYVVVPRPYHNEHMALPAEVQEPHVKEEAPVTADPCEVANTSKMLV